MISEIQIYKFLLCAPLGSWQLNYLLRRPNLPTPSQSSQIPEIFPTSRNLPKFPKYSQIPAISSPTSIPPISQICPEPQEKKKCTHQRSDRCNFYLLSGNDYSLWSGWLSTSTESFSLSSGKLPTRFIFLVVVLSNSVSLIINFLMCL